MPFTSGKNSLRLRGSRKAKAEQSAAITFPSNLYRQHVLESKGKNLDAQGRSLPEEDLRSPCTEEIAVFQAFSRIIREATAHFVVMDTAPTGHTLLLLDATGAYHREIARHMEGKSMYFTTPMMRLQDPE